MKKVGLYLILTFVTYLIGQLIWVITYIFDEPLFRSEYLEGIILIIIYTLNGIFGLIGSFLLYKNVSSLTN